LLRQAGAASLDSTEAFANQLLLRWGVVFRDMLARESLAPAWRDLLQVLRRMEARGEIRGGRFVSGFVGEQFARPEAVATLRAMRRDEDRSGGLVISTSDPLNLAGIILPGPRVSGLSGGDVRVLEPVALSAAAS
jgi:ATP-dependent Lhr-like helicase